MIINKKSAYLFILTGILFLFSGIVDSQISYYGVAIMFIILGIVGLVKNKPDIEDKEE